MDDIRTIPTNSDIAAIHAAARDARALCTDIIRQTSLKPIHGKYGGAAVYANADDSKAQKRRIAEAIQHMQRVVGLLHEVAVSGGMADASARISQAGDVSETKVLIIEKPDYPKQGEK